MKGGVKHKLYIVGEGDERKTNGEKGKATKAFFYFFCLVGASVSKGAH